MKSDLKINYGILEDIINQLHKYQGALGNMRDALSNIDSFVETNYGESIDAWKDKIKTSELNIKEYETQIKDLLSLFENYVTDTTSIIYPLEKYTMMRVNRNNIKKNLREIESGTSNNVTKAFYRTLDDPPGNWKFWDDISDAEKEASRYNKGRIESISQDILNTKVRLDNKIAEMWKIYDSKVVPFENMDDEYKGKADVIKDKYTTFWEGFWDTFGILESAGDLFRGIVDFALDTVEGLIALSEDAGIIIVSAIIPDAIEPDFLKQEAYDRLQPYKQALIQVIEDPKGVVENVVNSFTEMVDEEGMMYAIGYSGSSFIPMAGATKFTKLTKINDREAELKQYVNKTVKSNKSFEGVRLSPVEIVKNVRKFGSNLVNEVLDGMTVLKRMLESKEVPVLSGISSKNINVFDTGYLKGKAKEFYSWFRANVVGKGTDKVVKEYDVVPYRPANGKYGLENHHGVMNEWAKHNIPGYKEKVGKSPTVALSDRNNGGMHEATKKVYREWLRERTGRPVGAKVDWKNVSPKEMQKLTEEMFDAAKVPEATRREYYSQLNKFLYSLD